METRYRPVLKWGGGLGGGGVGGGGIIVQELYCVRVEVAVLGCPS